MGSAVNNNTKFVIDEKIYIDIIYESMKKNAVNSNEDVLKNYRC